MTNDIRIEGIRRTNVRTWAVVGSVQTPKSHDHGRTTILVREERGVGAKARAIAAAGTNRVVA